MQFRIDAVGQLASVYAENADDPVTSSALAAFRRAAPFGKVPREALCLAEEPFGAVFTLEAP